MNQSMDNFRCGYIAIIGRPNVGKSTLLNRILGVHLSITSKKPQTTRHRILGIKTTDTAQMVFIDTPGIHKNHKGAIHRFMNREATTTITEVDVILFMLDGLMFTAEDKYALQSLKQVEQPVILVLNKVDKLKNKDLLLPFINEMNTNYNFSDIIPVSSQRGDNLEQLQTIIETHLHYSLPYFDEEQLTDKSDRFLASELIREKVMRLLGQEVPYSVAVEIEAFEESEEIIKISAIIWVERNNQKSIMIGEKGKQLKEIGLQSRLSMQGLYQKRVYLKLWVKVKEGWSNDARALNSLGYDAN